MFRSKQMFLTVAVFAVICNPKSAISADSENKGRIQNSARANEIKTHLSVTSKADGENFFNPKKARLEKLERALDGLHKTLTKQQRILDSQEQKLNDQAAIIEEQDSVMRKQSEELLYLREKILSEDSLKPQRATGVGRPGHPPERAEEPETGRVQRTEPKDPSFRIAETDPTARQQAQNQVTEDTSKATRDPSTTDQQTRPQVVAIPEVGGVLTPRGRLVLEPGVQLSHSSFNRFTFLGVEIIDAFLVGLIQAEDTDRDLVSGQLTARYGITNRLEAEFKVPYIYRSDETSGTIPQLPTEDNTPVTLDRKFDGDGLGDIELAFHYQFNDGLDGWPFLVGNLRWKSDTGEGPFDVDRDGFGRENESPTGSGFHSLEPSLTILYPFDPVVFFANLGYLINLERDVNETIVSEVDTGPMGPGTVRQTFRDVDPGDNVRLSIGMGYALNERSSFTLGYKHEFIDETDFEITTVDSLGVTTSGTVSSNDLDVGSLLLGWGFALQPGVNANINFELGITQDAPDVLVTIRVPFTAYEF